MIGLPIIIAIFTDVAARAKLLTVIAAVGLALAGLISVQAYWAYHTYRLSEQGFGARVQEALKATANELNQGLYHYETFSKVHLRAQEGFYLLRQKWDSSGFISPARSLPDTIPIFYNHGTEKEFKWNSLKFHWPVNVTMVFQYEYTSAQKDTSRRATVFEKATLRNYRETFSENKLPYDVRKTASLLKKNLELASIGEPFHFGFIDDEKHSLAYAAPGVDTTALLNSPLRLLVTPSAYFSRPFDLAVTFDHYSGLVFAGMSRLLLLSALIVLALLLSFFVFVRMVLRQRRLSELKNDFINNMTHEFKTPLTNISLAVESIAELKLMSGAKEEQLVHIIGQESERLRENVDRILQIARFEKEKLQLSPEPVDIHLLLRRVMAVFDPISQKHEVLFRLRLEAKQPMLAVDETHFFNLVYNLVDNAIKYNSGKPELELSTRDQSDGMLITVKDNGIGIAATEQKRIFEKFYRVHTGNLHDVKGYGLGLSYVKLIAELHGGTVRVTSQPGQGSSFGVFIPYSYNA